MGTQRRARRVVVISDLHCGHRVGLTPPEWQASGGGGAAGHDAAKACAYQAALWDYYARSLAEIQPIDVLVVNGDAIDGRNQRCGGVELLVTDREEQCSMAAVAIRQARAARVLMTYGTPYHTGDEENWEDLVAKEAGAERIEAEGHYEINGCHIAAKHYIGNTTSPVARLTALSGAQLRQLLWATREQQPRADLIVRSHVHRCMVIMEPGGRWAACTTPGLQGLGMRYATRQGDFLPIDFGLIFFDISSAGNVTIAWRIAPLSIQRAYVVRL
jgi:hypothetical protein